MVTSSDAPVVAGVGYTDLFTLWARKTEKVPEPASRLRWEVGRTLEPLIHHEVERLTGKILTDLGDWALVVSDWAGATLDRIIGDHMTHSGVKTFHDYLKVCDGIAEFKTIHAGRAAEWRHGPDPYTLVQMHHAFAVTGKDWGYAVALVGAGDDLILHEVPRVDSVIEVLQEAEFAFWRHVQQDIPPPVGGEETSRTLQKLFPTAVARVIQLPAEEALLDVQTWRAAKLEAKELRRKLRAVEKLAVEAKNALTLRMGEADTLEVPGVGRFSWQQTKRDGYTVEPTSYRTFKEERK